MLNLCDGQGVVQGGRNRLNLATVSISLREAYFERDQRGRRIGVRSATHTATDPPRSETETTTIIATVGALAPSARRPQLPRGSRAGSFAPLPVTGQMVRSTDGP